MNGWESWDHWQTALWISNEQEYYNVLQELTELVVYGHMPRDKAITTLIECLPEQTPDGATWKSDVVARLLDEEYEEMIQYS